VVGARGRWWERAGGRWAIVVVGVVFIGVKDRTLQTKPGQNDGYDATVFGKEAELLKCMLTSWKLQ
jgi:hypothetical protein